MDSTSTSLHLLHFKEEIITELKADLRKIKLCDEYMSEIKAQEILNKFIKWLSIPPKGMVFRVNTIMCDHQVAYNKINEALKQYTKLNPAISTFPFVKELIIINGCNSSKEIDCKLHPNEIIVDAACGAAILRGAHIYAPGVLGMPRGLSVGDKVSVFADIKQACKKGLIKQYDNENKLYLGNGIIQLTREQIFSQDIKDVSGIAVTMTDIISHIPQLNNNILPEGYILLQNLPSIICSRILDPQSEEIVLDMCAAPGNKTTHLAALMKNKGTLVAVEKIKSKFEKLKRQIENYSIQNVSVFCFDSTKAVCDTKRKSVLDGPPFSEESFDRILLDGPCSALGQRPQLINCISLSQLRSYVPLQRKLFTAAVTLLKTGGTLVYSTCTITVSENEGIIAWALRTFPNLELQSISEMLEHLQIKWFASVGYSIDGLPVEQSDKLCRFGYESDTVGFFIARFIKR